MDKPIIFFLILLFIFSCKESEDSKKLAAMNEKLTNLNKKFKNKKIELEPKLQKTVFKNKPDSAQSLLVYYDANCSVCFSKLEKWKTNVNYFKEIK